MKASQKRNRTPKHVRNRSEQPLRAACTHRFEVKSMERMTHGVWLRTENARVPLNEPSAENPERMVEQESQPKAVGMEGCVTEGEGRGSWKDFAAVAPSRDACHPVDREWSLRSPRDPCTLARRPRNPAPGLNAR